jgi:hypothetical protein
MKKIYLIVWIALAFASCKKNGQLPADNGCISEVKRQNFNVKSSDSILAIQLLKQHNISYSDLQLEYFSSYNVPTGDNAGTYQSVIAIQRINGLAVLSGELWYQFKDNALQSTTGVRYGAVNLSTSSTLRLAQLRAAYLEEVNKHNSTIATNFKDSCLVAQFGYYDLNVNVSNTPNFVKAWVVAPKNFSFPQVIFQDGSSKTIFYNGGVIPFN